MGGAGASQIAEILPDLRYDVFPTASPREAFNGLSPARRERVVRFRDRLHATWATDAPHVALADALGELEPGSAACVFPGAGGPGPRWIAQTLTSDRATDAPVHEHELLGDPRLAVLRGADRFGDRPVGLAPLVYAATLPPDVMDLLDRVFVANQVSETLRMVLFDRGTAGLYAGLYRRPGEPTFGAEEHATLLAARPALRQWMRIAEAIGPQPLGDGALAATVQALDRPAVLLRRGRALLANAAAAPMVEQVLAWDRAGRPPGFADAAPLYPGGMPIDLVLPHAASPHAARSTSDLPPSLRRVGALLGEGLADKEIARRLGMPLTTVRTYVTRVLARTGVHSRRDLMPR
jgi:DNA-binding CsgD family transcriptional regulator